MNSDTQTPRLLRLGVWPGEGIGPEVVAPTVEAVRLALRAEDGADHSAVPVEFIPLNLGLSAFKTSGCVVPESEWEKLQGVDGWILGPHDNVSYPPEARGQLNPSAHLRKRADLWANIRPVTGVAGAVHPDLDVIIVRENTEGMYADRNMIYGSGDVTITEDVALAIGVFTRSKIRRICEKAVHIAAKRGGVLTVAHKANVLTQTSGIYLEEARAAAARSSQPVTLQPVHIDALCAGLVQQPERYRTIVAENMFGDILSDLAGGLGGSLGIAGSINAGNGPVMAQAVHGSAPDIAGRGVANPAAMMNSAAYLLRELGHECAAQRLLAAVEAGIKGAPTPDIATEGGAGLLTPSDSSFPTPQSSTESPSNPAATRTENFSNYVFAVLKSMV